MYNNKLFIFTAILFFLGFVGAKANDDVLIEIPKSRITSEVVLPQSQSHALELHINSWTPDGFVNHSSRIPVTEKLHLQMPKSEIRYLSTPLFNTANLAGLVSASFTYAERSARLEAGGVVTDDIQNTYFAAFGFGAQSTIPFRGVDTYLAATVSPTIAFTSESTISRGYTELTWPYQLSMGMRYRFFVFEAYSENLKTTGLSAGIRWVL